MTRFRIVVTAIVFSTALPGASAAQTPAAPITVPFGEPGRIGSVHVTLMNGDITITGSARRDVAITERGPGTDRPAPAQRPQPASRAGLRRLPQQHDLTVAQQNNQILISSSAAYPTTSDRHVAIDVPLRTNLVISTLDGDVTISNVDGEIEVTNMDGDVTLTGVAGSVVANSIDGDVTATMLRVSPDKAMAFTAFDGDVDVTLPADTKANLRLRSDQGEVWTDFDVTLTPAVARLQPSGRQPVTIVPVPPAPPAPAAPPAPPTPPTPGVTVPVVPVAPLTNPMDPAARAALRAQAAQMAAAARRLRSNGDQATFGTINGGGAEIELRTFDGDVIVRKGAAPR